MQEYKVEDIKQLIKSGLQNYQILFKEALRTSEFKKLNVSQRANAARVLVAMSDVAVNPDKYLGYAETHVAWSARCKQRVANKEYKLEKTARQLPSLMPEAPLHIMVNMLPNYVSGVLMSEYKEFLTAIREWNYKIAGLDAARVNGDIKMAGAYQFKAKKWQDVILNHVACVNVAADAAQSKGIKRLLHMWAYSMQRNG